MTTTPLRNVLRMSYKMRTLFQKPPIKSLLQKGDRLFSLVSLTSMPVLLSLCLYWHCETAPAVDAIVNPVSMVVSPGETTHLKSFYTVSFSADRALYSMWISDAQGKLVYKYEPQWVNNSSFTFGNQNIVVPKQLAPGNYSIRAKLRYPLNPFKTVAVDAELVHLEVVRK